MKNIVKSLFRRFGYELINFRKYKAKSKSLPKDFNEFEVGAFAKVRPYTMTTPERVVTLLRSVEYIIDRNIPGAFVECGVYKGGSMMAIALALLRLNVYARELYLYDTFSGMAEPGPEDERWAHDTWKSKRQSDYYNAWAYGGTVEQVKKNLLSTGYNNEEHIKMVAGKVEDTIPGVIPDKIALLRLDTDFYESTRHELEYLFPKLVSGGILIIDDYWAFQGSKKATQEYLKKNDIQCYLNRIDSDACLMVKP